MSIVAIPGRTAPVIVFGAFDRHNFGDLLFAHVAATLLTQRELLFAGLAERDLRAYGGHRVAGIAQLAAQCGHRPVHILHAGGELLTCDAWQAAVMLLAPAQARQIIARFGHRPQERAAWARASLGMPALAPYMADRAAFPGACRVLYSGVGGVDFDACAPAMRAEVLAKLRAADQVGVRDRRTQTLLADAGIASRLMPDPGVMTAALFGTQIGERARDGEPARVRHAFPNGYVAVQFSADFGDAATLTGIATQLDRVAQATGFGIVFFRAGAAPWHDALRCHQQVAARLRIAASTLFTSLHLWDICALLAGSRAYLGSSLHGRIVAIAFALPRVNLVRTEQGTRPGKQAAFAGAWEEPGMPGCVGVEGIAGGVLDALQVAPQRLRRVAETLAALYRAEFAAISAGLD